jgi:hypothetical protein
MDINSGLGSLHHLDVGSAMDVSELHAALILMVDLSRMSVHGYISLNPNPSEHRPLGLLNQSRYIYIYIYSIRTCIHEHSFT